MVEEIFNENFWLFCTIIQKMLLPLLIYGTVRYLTFQVYFLGLQARLDEIVQDYRRLSLIVFRENITASGPAKRIIGRIFLFSWKQKKY